MEKLEDYLFDNTKMKEGKCINKKTGNHIKALILCILSDILPRSKILLKYQENII